MRVLVFLLSLTWPLPLAAAGSAQTVRDVVSAHIYPALETLATSTQTLKTVAATECTPDSTALNASFHAAFDAWVKMSHLRFGPTEVDDRAFALAFWPDTKGFTPKALASLIQNEDSVILNPTDFANVSIAVRGFFALEFLLFDEKFRAMGPSAYHCQLVKAITTDLAANAQAILADWRDGYSDILLSPSATGVYRSDDEAVQELFKALNSGLQFTSETRLGRPLGTFERPRPTRAEARRSGRSLRHVQLSLSALRELALLLAQGDDTLILNFTRGFDASDARISRIDDPSFTDITNTQNRFNLELLQQAVNHIRNIATTELGPNTGCRSRFQRLGWRLTWLHVAIFLRAYLRRAYPLVPVGQTQGSQRFCPPRGSRKRVIISLV